MPERYRKKPVVIEAMRVDSMDYDGLCETIKWCGGRAIARDNKLIAIDTPEGTTEAADGDWIIKGVKGVQGEFYPCRNDIFEATYEPEGAS